METIQVGEEDSLWRLQLVRGLSGLEATLHRRDYLDTELEVIVAGVVGRDQRVVVFNFGTDRVWVLEKTSGSGTDRVRVLAPHFLSIGYYRVLKILIGYFSVTSLIRYFRLVQLLVQAALGHSTPVHPRDPMKQIKWAAQNSD